MSHPNTEAPKSSGGLMEDVIGIFVNPSATFDHQRDKSFVMPALIQSILFLILVVALKNLTAPFMDAEFARAMAAGGPGGQPMPPEAKAMSEKMAGFSAMAGPVILPWFSAIFGGLFAWLGARIVGAKIGYGQAAMIASWSAFPGVLGYVVMGIFGMVMDPATIRGAADGMLGPGRFFDPTTTSPALMALLNNIDLFNIWTIFLMGVGIAVVGRVSTGNGMIAALIKWGIVVLFSVVPAVLRG